MNSNQHAPAMARNRSGRSATSLQLRAALGTLLFAAICSGADARQTDAEYAAQVVRNRLADGDCQGAVSRLNDGLAKGYPEVQLLAGLMYDDGLCLKRNGERALHFFSLAADGGQEPAAVRLAARYSAPENGPDIAAALWWAARYRGGATLPAHPRQGCPG